MGGPGFRRKQTLKHEFCDFLIFADSFHDKSFAG